MRRKVDLSQMDAGRAVLELLSGEIRPADCTNLSTQQRQRLGRQLRDVVRWHRAGFITGFGLAPRLVNGFPCQEEACRIYVHYKRRPEQVQRADRIPPAIELEGVGTPVPLDVIELPTPRLSMLRFPQRPIFPGLSVGHCASGETGSIGALCSIPGRRERFLLSASHVLAVSGLAGRTDPIIQPGAGHGGSCPLRTIGNLDDVIPLSAANGFPNTADAALARLDSNIQDMQGSLAITRAAQPGQIIAGRTTVTKIGAATGRQTGLISDLHFRCQLPHRTRRGVAFIGFQEQIAYNSPSDDGDSGGPLITDNGALVGIHVGRSQSFAVATPIWAILDHWNLTF
jgi:Trypsin